jgi:hypothetical protein
MIVVKMGGSLIGKWMEIVSTFFEIHKMGEDFLLVPGGGKLAETVKLMGCDDESSHWMAVAAMEINGYYLASMGVEKLRPRDFSEIKTEFGVLLPYNLMLENDELPHSWEVTSDSIAIWVAGRLGAGKVIKLTDVDGIFLNGELVEEMCADDITFETCLDRYAPQLIKKFGIEVFICNGNRLERVKDYILRGKALGTLVRR